MGQTYGIWVQRRLRYLQEHPSGLMAVHGTAIHCPTLHRGIVSCYAIVCKVRVGLTLTYSLSVSLFSFEP